MTAHDAMGAVYVHVDLDVLDPAVGMANAFAAPGGFSTSDLRMFLEETRRLCPVHVVAFASYDPEADGDGAVCTEAMEAATSIFGATGR